MGVYHRAHLTGLRPRYDTFVGVDSDGCVFDTMEVKQKNHFHGKIAEFWGLQSIEPKLRQVAEFVNLYSQWRGTNRFSALLKTFELLEQWPEVRSSGVVLPRTDSLRAYVASGLPLGNPTLKSEAERLGDVELRRVYEWSLAVNADIAAGMKPVPAFPWARESLARMHASSDVIVVSQTPEEALVREWADHGLDGLVQVIAGQELGTKAEHLQLAAGGKYEPARILMIGDAPGDRIAAEAVGAWFYPINPGDEAASWRRFHDETYDRFLAGAMDASCQAALIEEFDARLPATPPWVK